MEKSGCSNAEDRAGQRGATRPGRTSLGSRSRRWRSLGPASGPGPSAHSQAAAAGGCARSVSREHKQGEEAGVSAWAPCQRAGAGTQCPERAGGRASGEREQPDSAAG